jgi:hypothetical protein
MILRGMETTPTAIRLGSWAARPTPTEVKTVETATEERAHNTHKGAGRRWPRGPGQALWRPGGGAAMPVGVATET